MAKRSTFNPQAFQAIVKVWAYLRVSTRKQARSKGEFGSLDKQAQYVKFYVDNMKGKGWTLTGTEREKGVKGSLFTRPALQRLIDAARRGEFQILVVASQDRLARGVDATIAVVRPIEAHGIKIFDASASRRITVNPAEPGYDATMQEAIRSGREEQTIRKRKLDEGIATATKGVFRGNSASLGFIFERVDKTPTIRPDPIKGKVVLEIGNRILRGEQGGSILADLKKRGVRTPSRKVKRGGKLVEIGLRILNWDHLKTIVENPLYCGCTSVSKRDLEKAAEQGLVFPLPILELDSGRCLFKGQFTGLRSVASWFKVYEAFNKRARVRRKPRTADKKARFLVQGLIRCGCCGRAMTNITHGRGGYVCMDVARPSRDHPVKCSVRRVPAGIVDDAVLRMIYQVATHADPIRAMMALQQKKLTNGPSQQKQLVQLGALQEERRKESEGLVDSINRAKHPNSKAMLIAKLDAIKQDEDDIRRKIETLTGSGDGEFLENTGSRRELVGRIEELFGAIQDEDRPNMKMLLRALFQSIVVTRLKHKDPESTMLRITMNTRYPQLLYKADGSMSKLQMDVRIGATPGSYAVEAPFSEARQLTTSIARAAKPVLKTHPFVKLKLYSALRANMRDKAIAAKYGMTPGYVSQIFSLQKIDADLRGKIERAPVAIRDRFTLTRLILLAKRPIAEQERIVTKEFEGHLRAAA